jgi:acyl-CoA thioester hydrolase
MRIEMREPVATTEYRVIYGDTDAGGVVYNANYLRYFEIGRTEMMRNKTITYAQIEEQGLILPVTETYLRYKAPAFYDDLLTISTSFVELKRVSCLFNYRVSCQRDGRQVLLVKGFSKHAIVDRQGKLTVFPESIKEKIELSFFNDR